MAAAAAERKQALEVYEFLFDNSPQVFDTGDYVIRVQDVFDKPMLYRYLPIREREENPALADSIMRHEHARQFYRLLPYELRSANLEWARFVITHKRFEMDFQFIPESLFLRNAEGRALLQQALAKAPRLLKAMSDEVRDDPQFDFASCTQTQKGFLKLNPQEKAFHGRFLDITEKGSVAYAELPTEQKNDPAYGFDLALKALKTDHDVYLTIPDSIRLAEGHDAEKLAERYIKHGRTNNSNREYVNDIPAAMKQRSFRLAQLAISCNAEQYQYVPAHIRAYAVDTGKALDLAMKATEKFAENYEYVPESIQQLGGVPLAMMAVNQVFTMFQHAPLEIMRELAVVMINESTKEKPMLGGLLDVDGYRDFYDRALQSIYEIMPAQKQREYRNDKAVINMYYLLQKLDKHQDKGEPFIRATLKKIWAQFDGLLLLAFLDRPKTVYMHEFAAVLKAYDTTLIPIKLALLLGTAEKNDTMKNITAHDKQHSECMRLLGYPYTYDSEFGIYNRYLEQMKSLESSIRVYSISNVCLFVNAPPKKKASSAPTSAPKEAREQAGDLSAAMPLSEQAGNPSLSAAMPLSISRAQGAP